MADVPNIKVVDEQAQGQPQARPAKPDDGKVQVYEAVVHTDEVVLDPNSKLAVQTPPEGSTAGVPSALALALQSGHVEDKFGTDEAPAPSPADPEAT